MTISPGSSTTQTAKKVLVAMSGGVDSSVAAWLLKRQGYEVVGLFMQHGEENQDAESSAACKNFDDADDARRVADRLEIPLSVLDFSKEFTPIIDHFVEQYLAGRTPNPCIDCNRRLKFGKLFDYADSVGADALATGHYARIESTPDGELGLYRGLDDGKDQAYFLFGIARSRLPRILFPTGGFRKEAIRRMAAEIGLSVAGKPDSQEICFIPDQDHAGFIRRRVPGCNTAGEFVTTEGTVVGRHDGFERFTVGQRKGLGIAMGEPYFVVRIEPETARVVIGRKEELACHTLWASEANWLIDPPKEPFHAEVKIRHRSTPMSALVTSESEVRFHVRFDHACYGVAPGQAAVCYDGDRVLGGGWIE